MLHHDRVDHGQVHHLPPLLTDRRYLGKALAASRTMAGRVHLHFVGIIGRGRFAAVAAVRGEPPDPSGRLLLLQSDDAVCELGHELANKRDHRVWASLIGF